METKLSSKTKEVIISDKGPTMLVGERINVTGKKKLSAALRAGDMDLVLKEALAQVQAGADILDVNVGIAGIDESALLPQVVQAVMDTVDIPLCLDSGSPKALEAALKVYQGKPLMNSVTGEAHSLKAILPLVKEYGAVVIGLVIDDEGIPDDPDRRVAIANKIIERAEEQGIPREDIVIDCLVQSVGADPRAALATIETIRKVKAELGVNLTVGASNGSFGLPDRELLNSAFTAMAIAAGVTCAIADVARIRPVVLAADLLAGRDEFARRYIEAYRQRQVR
ncbi:dihydropteroate synthase [Chloroflexota bacterium]